MKYAYLLLAVILSSAVCSPAVSATGDVNEYLINPGDTLSISVWQEPELQGDVSVRPDGYLSFPLVGQIPAAGKSITQIEDLFRERLREFIPDAVVTISVQALSGYKVYVIGQVRNPGEFILNTDIDVIRALAMAAGTNEFADLNGIKIIRRVNGRQTAIRFNYRAIEKGIDLEQNILLQSGDVVVVP